MTNEDETELSLPFDDWASWNMPLIICLMKFSAVASISGSSVIIYQILGNRRERLGKFYHRIMLSLSVFDIIGSFAIFIGSWVIPADTANDFHYGNIGTVTTCDIQALLLQVGQLSAMNYSSVLSLYFMLVIRYNWSEMCFRKYEPLWHLGAILFPVVTGAYGVKAKIFNPGPTMCWVQSYPFECDTSNTVNCIRGGGGNTATIRLMFVLPPVVVAFSVIAVSMILLNRFVNKQRLRTLSYSSRFTNRRHSEQTQKVFMQSCWYVGAFLAVWIPTIIHVYLGKIGIYSFVSYVVTFFLLPLQGFSYALIYTKSNTLITEYISSTLRRISTRFSIRSMSITSVRTTDLEIEELAREADSSGGIGSFNDLSTEANIPPLKVTKQTHDEEEGQQIIKSDQTEHINLIPMGAYLNIYSGEYDSFLLSYLDDGTEEFKTLCLIYREKGLYQHLEQAVESNKPKRYDVSDALECDIWFAPNRPIRVRHGGIVLERDLMYDVQGEPVYALKTPLFKRFCNEEEACITTSELSALHTDEFASDDLSDSERSFRRRLRMSFKSISRSTSSLFAP